MKDTNETDQISMWHEYAADRRRAEQEQAEDDNSELYNKERSFNNG